MKRWLRISQLARTSELNKSRAGYTLLEVMIVLAVSTLVFVAIAATFSGRQARVEFTQALRNYESGLQNIISDVAEGSYQSGFTCQASSAGGSPTFSNGTQNPGSNLGCIFLGKIVASEQNQSDVLTIVGRRTVSNSTRDVSTLPEAAPVAVRPPASSVDVTVRLAHTFNLEVRRVVDLADGITQVAAFGFVHQLGGGIASSGTSSRSVLLYGIPNSIVAPNAAGAAASALGTLTPLNSGLVICIQGGNGQRAEMRIGENNSQTAFITEVFEAGAPNTGACNGA